MRSSPESSGYERFEILSPCESMAIPRLKCWCGNPDLLPFSPGYRRCPKCETLVALQSLQPQDLRVKDEARDFYGREYWFSHQQKDLGFPDIVARSRSDLSERCLHWLHALLKYKIPPAKILEVGSAHGGFVALLEGAGFDAVGLELSPWVVELAERTFGVSMLAGPIEDQSLASHSLEAIVLMDVLEHFPDPLGTVKFCLGLLAERGVLVIQTPRYPEGKGYEELLASRDRFLEQLKSEEHLFIFSRQSIQAFLNRLGIEAIAWEPALFPHYDMFLFGSRSSLPAQSPEAIERALSGKPQGRIIQALLDLYGRHELLHGRLLEAEADRAARLEVIREADRQLKTLNRKIQDLEKSPLFLLLRKLRAFLLLNSKALRKREIAAPLLPVPDHSSNPTAPTPGAFPKEISRIAVDLIPLLPGGENGGAKLLAIAMVRSLRQVLPKSQFLLLTADWNHEALSFLDAPNVRRLCLASRSAGQNPPAPSVVNQPGWKHRLLQAAQYLPPGPRKRLKSIFLSLSRHRRPVPDTLRAFRAQIYFCPFTLPFFSDPSVPVVSVLYDLQFLYYPYFFDPAEHIARERNFRETCRRANRIVCISEFVRQTVLSNSNLAPDRLTTVPIQLGKRLAKTPKETIRTVLEKYRLQENGFFFYPANYWPHKNHPMLFTALGIFQSRHPESPLRLVCCGALEEERSSLQRWVRRLGLGSRVRLLGFLPEEEFASLFSSCRALIFPSLYEGFGMPLVEAMEMGKPVLCSQGTSLPEVAGEAALYFDSRKPESIAEALERISADERLVDDLVLKGKSRSRRFLDEEKMAREYVAVFQEVLS